METKMKWIRAQNYERKWWGNCVNTYYEETKQLVYAKKIGLVANYVNGKYPVYDLEGKSVLDIGGGAVSILLKCINIEQGYVVDPCEYPEWVRDRYRKLQILCARYKGEDLARHPSTDEVWIYNVLQHVENPKKVVKNALRIGKIVRLFEWLEVEKDDGHINILHREELDRWLGGYGKVEKLNENGCNGLAYYGIFKGDKYGKT